MRYYEKLLKPGRAFIREQEGSTLPFIALGIFMLVGAAGVAIDMGRLQIVQSRLQTALDAAGLAVGSEISTANISTETTKYFYANFPTGFLGTTITTGPTATPNGNNTIINLAVSGTVSMTFMQIFGKISSNVSATSQVTRQSSGMELVLVLDNTGSMNNPVNPANSSTPKIAALQSASTTLLNILYGSNNTTPNLWVGVVPFSQTVNIGTGHSAWMDSTYDATLEFGPTITGSSCQSYNATSGVYSNAPSCSYITNGNGTSPAFLQMNNWSGCVMARPSPYDVSDDVPTTSRFPAYAYPGITSEAYNYDPWKTVTPNGTQSCTGSGANQHCTTVYNTTTTIYNYSYQSSLPGTLGPNLFCPQPVLPMVAEKNTVVNEINSLTAAGSTLIDIGMAWGYRMLSPNWRGLWGGEMNTNQLPLNYNTPLMNKVLILMTDGINELDPYNFTAYKYLDSGVLGTTDFTTANNTLNSRTLSVCTALKNNGVIIYTIGFGTDDTNNMNNPTSVNGPLLKACASQPSYYFLAPTNAQLTTVFQQIGDSLSNLYMSH